MYPCGEQTPVTARSTGPINRPIIPNAIRPPITPERIRSSGKSAPMRMSTGRITLSRVPTTALQTSSTVPGGVACPVKPDNGWNQYRQRPQLNQTRKDHHYRQQSSVRHAGNRQPDAAKYRLYQRGDHHAKRHGADRWAASRTAASPRLAARRQAKWRIPIATCSPRQ